MIPVRVPADLAPHVVRDDCTLGPDHPLWGKICPVCDRPMGPDHQRVALVAIGVAPEDQKAAGWTTGAAIAVHAPCTNRPLSEGPADA